MTTGFVFPPLLRLWMSHGLVLLLFCCLCGLGFWQVQRLAWKTELLSRLSLAGSVPPEPLTVVLGRFNGEDVQANPQLRPDLDYIKVQFSCPDLEQRPRIRLYVVREQGPAKRLITACPIRIGAYKSLLVDLGLEISKKGRLEKKDAAGSGLKNLPLIGLLRYPAASGLFTPKHIKPEEDWYGRDIPAMAAALGVKAPAPVFFMLQSPKSLSGDSEPDPISELPSNPHLGYAITWFGLAFALIAVYIGLVYQKIREKSAKPLS